MKYRVFYMVFVILISLIFHLTVIADSITVNDTLYENIYVKGNETGYQILFPETGEVKEVRSDEVDAPSIVYSPPLDRVKILDSWENTPLQIKLRKELEDNADQITRQEEQEKELQMLREQKEIEQNKLDQKRREYEETERQQEQQKQQQEEEKQKKEETERKIATLQKVALISSVVVGVGALLLICFLPSLIAAKRKQYALFVLIANAISIVSGIVILMLNSDFIDIIASSWKLLIISLLSLDGEIIIEVIKTIGDDLYLYDLRSLMPFGIAVIGYLGAFAWATWPKHVSAVTVNANDTKDNSMSTTSMQSISFKDKESKLYVHVNDQVKGPYTTDQIHSLLKNGKLNINSLVCQEGTEAWLPVSSFLK